MPPFEEPAPPQTPSHNPVVLHPYLAAGILLICLLVFVFAIVLSRAPVAPPENTSGTWGGAGGINLARKLANPGIQRKTPEQLLEEQSRETIQFFNFSAPRPEESGEISDFSALLSELTRAPNPGNNDSGTSLSTLYSFIPQGLISAEVTTEKRSDAQQALYEYGNTIASFLLAFEDSHRDMLRILKDAHEDRGNPEKTAAAERIGDDYIRLSEELMQIETLPPLAQTPHAAFAAANNAVGERLKAVASARSDDDFLAAIDAYNVTVEGYTKQYVALATLFAASEVRFNTSDPGSVFTFSSTPSF